MSLTEEIAEAAETWSPPTVAGAHRPHRPPQRVLLVWDAPNLDMGLGSILGGRPDRRAPAPIRRAGPLAAGPHRRAVAPAERPATSPLEPEATVFTNIAPGSADVVRPWVEALRNVGFAVFAKPKIDDDSDVDSDMLDHIALRRSEGLAGAAGGLGRRTGVPAAARGHRPRRVSPSRCSDFANMRVGR